MPSHLFEAAPLDAEAHQRKHHILIFVIFVDVVDVHFLVVTVVVVVAIAVLASFLSIPAAAAAAAAFVAVFAGGFAGASLHFSLVVDLRDHFIDATDQAVEDVVLLVETLCCVL
jgi:hypothetical protein